MEDLGHLLTLARNAAGATGKLLLERFRAPAAGVESKSSPTDLVSDADRDAEALLLKLISAERPEDGVIGEEGARRDSSSGLWWVIDPLDGTINFLFGAPVWSVSVAIRDRAETLVGVVHDPNRDEMFTAVKGGRAHLNERPIQVSERADLAAALIGTGFSYDAEARAEQASLLATVLPRVRDVRRAGSAALDLASVSCGRLDGFYEAPMEEWDRAAGVLLIAEAGGVVSELPAPFGLSPGVIAGGAAVHDALKTLLLG